jgi:hypothetical protein
MYLFIHGLFNDAVRSSAYTALNDTMINNYKILQDTEGNGRDLL